MRVRATSLAGPDHGPPVKSPVGSNVMSSANSRTSRENASNFRHGKRHRLPAQRRNPHTQSLLGMLRVFLQTPFFQVYPAAFITLGLR